MGTPPPRTVSRSYDGWTDLLAAIFRGTTDLAGAACMAVPPALFDPPNAGEPAVNSGRRQRAALDYCTQCPVIERCREWSTTQPDDGAIRGGARAGRATQPKKAG